jgi:molybdopterin molybdotransferase
MRTSPGRTSRPLLSVDEALALVLDRVPDQRTESVPLADAGGRVLAETVTADRDYPAFPRSRVDGYAVRAADVRAGVELPVAMEIAAGAEPAGPLPEGAAARIFTGAPAPDGADCVVMQEDCLAGGGAGADAHVRIDTDVDPGYCLVPRGYELREGETVGAPGDVIDAGLVGALASVGAHRVEVTIPPRGRVVSTGDELVPVDALPGPGQIRNSNAAALLAALTAFGARADGSTVARDDEGSLAAAVEFGLDADVCLLTGGVSVGDYDLVPQALEAAGVENVFHGVRLQPGKPLWFGVRGRTLVFGLPGNPVSSLVTATLFARPAIRALLGLPAMPPGSRRAVLLEGLAAGTWRRRYEPVRTEVTDDGRIGVRNIRYRGSGDIFGFAAADALAIVPEEAPAPEPGQEIVIVPLSSRAVR